MNSLRGISALTVAFVHAFQVFCLPMIGLYTFPHLFSSCLATYSIVIFFIVSGFMIYISVQNHSDEYGFNALTFFKSRLLRIYPPLLASLVLCVIIFVFMHGFKIHGHDNFRLGMELFVSRENISLEFERLFSTIFLMYNIFPGSQPAISMNGPLWTLSYEWWFYLFIMALVQACSAPKNPMPLFFVLFFITLFFFSPAGQLLWVFLGIWGSGYCLGYLYHRKKLPQFYTGHKIWGLIVACAVAILMIGQDKVLDCLVEPLERYGKQGHYTLFCTGLLLTIGIGAVIWKKTSIKLFKNTASYAYTLYLVHFPFQLLCFGFLHKALVNKPLLTVLGVSMAVTFAAVLLASILAKYVENRAWILQLCKRVKI